MTEYALRLANDQDTAARMRLGDSLHLTPAAGVLQARAGVRPGTAAVTVVAGTMAVEVAPFVGWVDGTTSDAQGGYPFVLDAAKQLTLDAGDPALARVDTIVARVYDDMYDGGGVTTATVEVVKGTPGGGAPALPASALPLRDVNVPAGRSVGTGGLVAGDLSTDRRRYTSSLGGVLPVVSEADRNAVDPAVHVVYRLDTKVVEYRAASGWLTLGSVNPNLPVSQAAAANTSGSQTVWTVEAGAVSLAFVAPTSGKVLVSYSVYVANTGTGGHAEAGLRLSGPGVNRDPSDWERVVVKGAGAAIQASASYLLTGLTPGGAYTLTSARRAEGGATTFVANRLASVTAA